MRAAVINDFNRPPQYLEFEEPIAAEGEVAVAMQAAGLHPIVRMLASGKHYSSDQKLPFIPGLDGVGLLDGRLVYCTATRPPFGSMAERTLARPKNCIPLPDGIDPVQAAAIANPGMSAWLSLTLRAGFTAGETVLILGATGVAGRLAMQSARYLGAKKIIAAGRNPETLAALGADVTVLLTDSDEEVREAFAAQLRDGVDVIIDYLWGKPTELLLAALATTFRRDKTQRTRLVEVGSSAGQTITLPAAVLRSIDLHLCGGGFGSVPIDQIIGSIPTLFSLAAAGHLAVEVQPIPLSEITAAWNSVEKGKRLVFTI